MPLAALEASHEAVYTPELPDVWVMVVTTLPLWVKMENTTLVVLATSAAPTLAVSVTGVLLTTPFTLVGPTVKLMICGPA